MAHDVDQAPEPDTDGEQPKPVLDLQGLDDNRPEVEAHFNSPLCLEI